MKFLEQYKILHREKEYGVSGGGHVPQIMKLMPKNADSILDYGAGQSDTGHLLKMKTGIEDVVAYDPAVVGRNEKPRRSFDVVICTDVMEHIPEDEIMDVLLDIRRYCDDTAIFAIALREAAQTLPNGENAHCTVKPTEWWHGQLLLVFDEVEHIPTKKYYWAWFTATKNPRP
jgi:hypothetical protein